MPGDELLRVFHIDRLAGFEVEDDLMLCAVEFEDAADIFRAREQQQEADEDREANHTVDGVEEDLALDHGRLMAQIFGQFEGEEFVDSQEENKSEDHLNGHYPTRDFGGFGG